VIRAATLIAAAALLAACGEKPQTAGGIKSDNAAFQGTGKPYVVQGWKPGDRTSWEQQLKTRTNQGQNDYAKVN
jgi:major membrane immunogen (membrane-anchored lipoprotein)